MPVVKAIKTKAYFKRYQTKFKRRRQGKTDYYARKRLTVNSGNKYASPKYRLVVRFTNKAVIAQIVYAEASGDKTVTSAYSTELKRYGLSVGLKNYAAAYCTGLLVARRALKKLGLDELYEGNTEVDGEIHSTSWGKRTHYVAEMDDDKRPFRVALDVGVRRVTTGCRLMGALKGASDGGLDIPHSEKRFPGYDREAKEYSPDEHREWIFGQKVAEYMNHVKEEDEENGTDVYGKLFSSYVKAGVEPDGLEELYEKVHAAIRADPTPKHGENFKTRNAGVTHDAKFRNQQKLSYEERKARVQAKLEKMQGGDSSDEDDE